MSRIMFRFWLDDSKDDENTLIGQVEQLKENRKFTETIRQGIQLITDLRNGSLKVLFDLFPYVKAEFLEYVTSLNQAEQDALEKERQELEAYRLQLAETAQQQNNHVQQQLERIEKLLVAQGHTPINSIATIQPNSKPAAIGLNPLSKESGGIKPLAVQTDLTHVFDDDDDDFELVVTQAETSGSNATQNFLNSMMNLQRN